MTAYILTSLPVGVDISPGPSVVLVWQSGQAWRGVPLCHNGASQRFPLRW
jgi:hypothetical protein